MNAPALRLGFFNIQALYNKDFYFKVVFYTLFITFYTFFFECI